MKDQRWQMYRRFHRVYLLRLWMAPIIAFVAAIFVVALGMKLTGSNEPLVVGIFLSFFLFALFTFLLWLFWRPDRLLTDKELSLLSFLLTEGELASLRLWAPVRLEHMSNTYLKMKRDFELAEAADYRASLEQRHVNLLTKRNYEPKT